MGRFMIVRLKKTYVEEHRIEGINRTIHLEYGAAKEMFFVTRAYVEKEVAFYNNTEEGKAMLPDFPRPLTVKKLSEHFEWYEPGCCYRYIRTVNSLTEAFNLIAISKWIVATNGKYIRKSGSSDYSKEVLSVYLSDLLRSYKIDINGVWNH